jgi:hypothetical protein
LIDRYQSFIITIQEVLDLNLSWESGYPNGFVVFYSSSRQILGKYLK